MTRLGHVERVIMDWLQAQPASTSELAAQVMRPTYQVWSCLRRLRARGLVDQLGVRANPLGAPPALWRMRPRREAPRRLVARDEDVLAALEHLRTATVAQITERSGWARSGVYRSLRELEVRGLVREVVPTGIDHRGRSPALWSVQP